jgi:hypothetical protein
VVTDLLMFLLGGMYFLPCALAAGVVAGLAGRRRSALLATLVIFTLWLLTGAALFALRFYKVPGIAPGDLRLLNVTLSAVSPVYGLALLAAVVVIYRGVRPFIGALLTTAAGAVGCIFVLPAFIAGSCSTFGQCP